MDKPLVSTPSMDDLILLHELLLNKDGGLQGLRDLGALQSAMGRVESELCYGEGTLAACAATLAYGLAKNHPFADGNKRTALGALRSFLRLNGATVECGEDEQVHMICDLAQDSLSQSGLAAWIQSRIAPVASDGKNESPSLPSAQAFSCASPLQERLHAAHAKPSLEAAAAPALGRSIH